MILNKRKLKVRDELAKSGIPLFEMYSSLSVDTGVLTRDHESLFEICYLKRGSQNHYIDGEEYILQSGEVFITFPQDKHSYSNFSQTMGCLYWLQVDSECLSILGLDHDSTKLIINSLFSLKSRKFPIRDDIAAKLIKAYSIADNGNDIDIVEAKSLLIVFLCELIGSSNSENRRIEVSEPIIIAKNYIDSNIKEKISLSSISEMINFSLSHFKCKFKKEIGIPPGEYILRRKIYDSMSMLPDKSLTYIAYEYSFSSPQHYSKIFKIITGLTPKEYKSNIKKTHQNNLS